MLQDSIGGNSKTTLIITCSPSSYNEQETLSTQRFGTRAKAIKNAAKINKEYTVAELLKKVNVLESKLKKKAKIIKILEDYIQANNQELPEVPKDLDDPPPNKTSCSHF